MDELFEVTRDEYVGFIAQINHHKIHTEHITNDDETAFLKVYSNKDDTLYAEQFLDKDGVYHYYVYEMPPVEERQAPPQIRRYVLETKEEVQNFFNALSKIQNNKKKKHD